MFPSHNFVSMLLFPSNLLLIVSQVTILYQCYCSQAIPASGCQSQQFTHHGFLQVDGSAEVVDLVLEDLSGDILTESIFQYLLYSQRAYSKNCYTHREHIPITVILTESIFQYLLYSQRAYCNNCYTHREHIPISVILTESIFQ